MEAAAPTRVLSRQLSTVSLYRSSGRLSFRRQSSLNPRPSHFVFGSQSSLDPNHQSPIIEELSVPNIPDSTMQLLFMASQGDMDGVEDILDDGVDVNSIDLDGRTTLHIAACEGHVDVVKMLLS